MNTADPLAVVRASFAEIEPYGTELTAYIYERFFAANPRYRKYFAGSGVLPGESRSGERGKQHERLLTALRQIIDEADRIDRFLPHLRQLALDHRKFGIRERHYRAFGVSVIEAVAHFLGERWTPDLAAAWQTWYGLVASVMLSETEAADKAGPRFWDAEVVSLDRIAPDIVRLVAHVEPTADTPYRHVAGQYAAVELCVLPRVWRDLSFAAAADENAPEHVEFHIQRTSGGVFSAAVHEDLAVGDRIRVAPPRGSLRLPTVDDVDELVAVVQGTGLAPVIALLSEAVSSGDRRPVTLFVGGLTPDEHYSVDLLAELAERHGALRVVRMVESTAGRSWDAEIGSLPEVLGATLKARLAERPALDPARVGGVLVGPTAIVEAARDVLVAAGVNVAQLRSDLFDR